MGTRSAEMSAKVARAKASACGTISGLDLLGSKTFCMIPWVHLHVWPEGNSYPCCFFDAEQPIGA